MKLKYLLSGFLVLLPFLFSSCEEDYTPTFLNQNIVDELPYCNTLLEDSSLISNDEIRSMVCNSDEEVKRNFSPKFLSVYPEYERVDFNRYSVLVITSIIQGKVMDRSVRYYKSSSAPHYYCAYTYEVDTSDQQFYKERTAVVVEKLKADETVEIQYSVS